MAEGPNQQPQQAQEALPTPMPMRLEIRKYPNRRYYDATRSRHVTLEEMYALIRDGYEVQISDSRTGTDITPRVLAQIIIDLDPPKWGAFPVPLLHRLLRSDEPGAEASTWPAAPAAGTATPPAAGTAAPPAERIDSRAARAAVDQDLRRSLDEVRRQLDHVRRQLAGRPAPSAPPAQTLPAARGRPHRRKPR